MDRVIDEFIGKIGGHLKDVYDALRVCGSEIPHGEIGRATALRRLHHAHQEIGVHEKGFKKKEIFEQGAERVPYYFCGLRPEIVLNGP